MAALLAVSLPATNKTVNQHTSLPALPSDPIPGPSLMPSSVSSITVVLQSPNANYSLSLPENLTPSLHFHIPDTPIDLNFIKLGKPLALRTVSETVELAIDKISTHVRLRPTESITSGFFQQSHEGLAIIVHQYVGKQITWFLLNWLLLGIQYYTSQSRRSSRELWFEIDVAEKGNVGYGSLWHTGLEGKDVAKRDVKRTSQLLRVLSISKPAMSNSNHSLLLPIPNESKIVFSYHFYGPTIPESEITTCFTLARQSIRTTVQVHPHNGIPDGLFQYRADDSPVSIRIKAYDDREITWLLLDDILHIMSGDVIGERNLWACEFEFEIYPVEEVYGHGSLLYDLEAILPASSSQIAASAVKKTVHQLGYVNQTFNESDDTASISNPTPEWAVVVPVPGTPIRLLINSLGNHLLLWDVASTLSGARNEILSSHGIHPNLPISDGHFQYHHAGSSVWVRVVARSGMTITWQDLNDVLKGLFDFLCKGTRQEVGACCSRFTRMGREMWGLDWCLRMDRGLKGVMRYEEMVPSRIRYPEDFSQGCALTPLLVCQVRSATVVRIKPEFVDGCLLFVRYLRLASLHHRSMYDQNGLYMLYANTTYVHFIISCYRLHHHFRCPASQTAASKS